MIARTWHGAVPVAHGAAFGDYLRKTGVAEAGATPGNLDVRMTHCLQDGYDHFFMVSYWTDMTAVKRFAGDAPQVAVTYPEDAAYGLISDPIVLHHEVPAIPEEVPWQR